MFYKKKVYFTYIKADNDCHPKTVTSAEKITNKTLLLWNIPGHIRENPPFRFAPERNSTEKKQKHEILVCVYMMGLSGAKRQGGFSRMWPDMIQSSQVLLVIFFSTLVAILGWHVWCLKESLTRRALGARVFNLGEKHAFKKLTWSFVWFQTHVLT